MSQLDKINDFHDLKKMSHTEIKQLCDEIRSLIIDISKTNDIHLSSNLGIVELSTMILKVFDIDKDILLYDTGHQTYVHKILTGRKDKIRTIRKDNSLCGLMNMKESKYDHYSPGHSGNVLSVISGMYQKEAVANANPNRRQFYNERNYLAVVGDSAFANGMNFEALNDISYNNEPIIVILNDNDMSISKSVGALSITFNKIKGFSLFHNFEILCRRLWKFNRFYYWLFNSFNWFEHRLRNINFFENLGYYYIGPVDGHNIKQLEKALLRAKWFSQQGPIIVHVKTKKGKGLQVAEKDQCGSQHSSNLKFEKTIGMHLTDELLKMMQQKENIYVINPAMTHASNCEILKQNFPHRYLDVGISEEHAISKASGMSLKGLKPYVYIYSTFLQRGYDQLLSDVARLELNCTLLIDRADLSGGDGSSHHGIFDVSFLKTIPNVLICSGRNMQQNIRLLELSYDYNEGIFAIRYPKNIANPYTNKAKDFKVSLYKWEWFEQHKTITIIVSYGPYINKILHEIYEKENVNVVNAIFISKYDEKEIVRLLKTYKNVLVYERTFGDGLAQDFFKCANKLKTNNNIISMHYQQIVENGSTDSLDKKANMDLNAIKQTLKKFK